MPKAEQSVDLSRLMKPRSIAIVGASDNPASIGGQPVRFLTEFGYSGTVYPINPRLKEIRGLPCYASVADLPAVPDVVIVAVGARLVASVIEQSGQRGIPFAIILSAGFREIGPAGAKLQEELEEVIRRSGIRVVGPNCLGIINLPDCMHAGFGAGFSLVVLLECLRGRLATVQDVTQRVGLRVIGTVPTISPSSAAQSR